MGINAAALLFPFETKNQDGCCRFETGYGYLPSETLSRQDVGDRAFQGQGETGESGREGSLGCGLERVSEGRYTYPSVQLPTLLLFMPKSKKWIPDQARNDGEMDSGSSPERR